MTRAAALAVCLAAATAHAEPPKGKSRVLAQALAGIGTGVSAGLAFTSLWITKKSGFGNVDEVANPPLLIAGLASSVVTPSLGQYYAGEYWSWGMAVRALSGGAIALGAFGLTENPTCVDIQHPDNQEHHCRGLTEIGVAVIAVGVIGYVGGVAYDLYDTPDAVDRYNAKHGIYVSPTLTMDPATGSTTVGIAGRF